MLGVDNLVFVFLPPFCLTDKENNKRTDKEVKQDGE